MDDRMKGIVSQEMKSLVEGVSETLDGLSLDSFLKNRNPFVLALVNFDCNTMESCLWGFVQASLETNMGKRLENIAIALGGTKSSTSGVDLDIIRGNYRLLISVKSGPNWGNSQSTTRQGQEFKNAKRTILQNDKSLKVMTVMGICYGKCRTSDKGNHWNLKIEGQNLWYLLSGDKDFYKELAKRIAQLCYGQSIREKVAEATSRLCQEFEGKYGCDDDRWGSILERYHGNYTEKDGWMNELMPLNT